MQKNNMTTSVLEDAVHIGIQMALYGKVEYDKDGQVKRSV